MPAYFSALVLLVLAWGGFAFGAVYDWAYVPLFWAAAAVGALGWIAPGAAGKPKAPWAIVGVVALVAGLAGLQLVPLSPAALARVSPGADRFLSRYDLAYAYVRSGPDVASAGASARAAYRHPLSIDPAGTRGGLAALGAFALLLTGVSRGLGRASLRALAAGLVMLGTLMALVGLAQSGLYARHVESSGLIYGFWKPENRANPFGPFVNHNHFAGWLLLVLPLAIAYFCALVERGMRGVRPHFRDRVLWFSSPDASRAILVGLAIAVMGVSMVFTLSRSGIAGFLFAVAVAGWLFYRRQVHGSKRAVVVGFMILVLVASLGYVGVGALAARFDEGETRDFGGRLPIWSDTAKVIRDFPWTGTGLNTYGTSMLLYQEYDRDSRVTEAHNDYLQVAAEGGVLLGIPALLLLLVVIREVRRRFAERADDPTEYWLRIGAATGMLAMGLQETVEFSLQMPGIAALFAVVAAIAIRPGRT
jgi:O-antigen ligase